MSKSKDQDGIEVDASIYHKFNSIIAYRSKLYAGVQRIFEKSKSLTTENFEENFSLFDKLKSLEEKFEQIQEDAIAHNAFLLPESEYLLEINKCNESFDDLIFEAQKPFIKLAKLCGTMGASSLQPVQTASQPQIISVDLSSASVPTIELEPFSGEIGKWNEFISLYNSLFHSNKNLDKVAKFRHLKTHLIGEAKSVISQYALTEDLYETAYHALCSRYDNKRVLADYYVDTLLRFKRFDKLSQTNLQNFLNIHTMAVNSLKKLAIADLGDYFCMVLALNNLDDETRDRFERKNMSGTIPTYGGLIAFLTERLRQLELNPRSFKDSRKSNVTMLSRENQNEPGISSNASAKSPVNKKCHMCSSSSHFVTQCPKYLSLPIDKRYDTFKTFHLCFRCGSRHPRKLCHSKGKCQTCGMKSHHSTLHRVNQTNNVTNVSPTLTNVKRPDSEPPKDSVQKNVASPSLSKSCISDESRNSPKVLLGTFRALISDVDGHQHVVRGVLDLCSEVSAISSQLVQKLGLKVSELPCSDIVGFGQSHTKPEGVVQMLLSSTSSSNNKVKCFASVVTSISGNIPSEANLYFPDEFKLLSLSDPTYWLPSRVDILLGAHTVGDVLTSTGHNVVSNGILTLSTVFGHILIGSTPLSSRSKTKLTMCTTKGLVLDETLRRFWELETIDKPVPENPEDRYVEQQFQDTVRRDKITGQYSISLPFKVYPPPLKNNRAQALKCFLSLELRLKKQPERLREYRAFMSQYLEMGHMEIAKSPSSYVIPHHCVVKESSSTTKLRVVFNGSSIDTDGNSLNSFLYSGPKLHNPLPNILTMFRTFKIAFCCDIQKMFRMIGVNGSDRVFQHIFYRPNPDSEVLEYELTTVTYGLASSPYHAQAAIRQLVRDEGSEFPIASKILTSSIFVDDILYGCNSLSEGLNIRDELVTLLKKGNFELRKWHSNDKCLLDTIPKEHQEVSLSLDPDFQCVKVLGLLWLSEKDCFSFRVLPFTGTVTKRTVMSYIARVYDPLGFLGPVVFFMKCFLQKLWKAKIDWDSNLNESLEKEWLSFVEDMPLLSKVAIPRYVNTTGSKLTICAYCDASERGCCAVIYLCNKSENKMFLLAAKTQLAPVNPLTIPRLELCAALLLSRLYRSSEFKFANLDIESVQFFSDSATVLSWIRLYPNLEKFVANRVGEIRELTNPYPWGHVRGEDNPADCGLRGLTCELFLEHPLWFNGPPLETLENRTDFKYLKFEELPETKRVVSWSTQVKSSPNVLFEYVVAMVTQPVDQKSYRFLKQASLTRLRIT